MKIEYLNRDEMFSVETDELGRFYLCVIVGGMAMSEKKILMDEAMYSQFCVDPAGLIPWVKSIRMNATNN